MRFFLMVGFFLMKSAFGSNAVSVMTCQWASEEGLIPANAISFDLPFATEAPYSIPGYIIKRATVSLSGTCEKGKENVVFYGKAERKNYGTSLVAESFSLKLDSTDGKTLWEHLLESSPTNVSEYQHYERAHHIKPQNWASQINLHHELRISFETELSKLSRSKNQQLFQLNEQVPVTVDIQVRNYPKRAWIVTARTLDGFTTDLLGRFFRLEDMPLL